MIRIHSITFPARIVLGELPTVHYILSDIILGLFDAPKLIIFQALNTMFVWLLSSYIRTSMAYFYFQVIIDCPQLFTLSNLYRHVFNARILSSFGSVLIHYFAATMLLYI